MVLIQQSSSLNSRRKAFIYFCWDSISSSMKCEWVITALATLVNNYEIKWNDRFVHHKLNNYWHLFCVRMWLWLSVTKHDQTEPLPPQIWKHFVSWKAPYHYSSLKFYLLEFSSPINRIDYHPRYYGSLDWNTLHTTELRDMYGQRNEDVGTSKKRIYKEGANTKSTQRSPRETSQKCL